MNSAGRTFIGDSLAARGNSLVADSAFKPLYSTISMNDIAINITTIEILVAATTERPLPPDSGIVLNEGYAVGVRVGLYE